MTSERKFVLNITDVPFLETPDGTMRDSFLITEDTCGAKHVSAGLVFVPPNSFNHEDVHHVEEFFFIVEGKGQITYDGVPKDVEAGDFVFMPAGVKHRVINNTDKPYIAVWAILCNLDELGSLKKEMETWHAITPGTGWSQWSYLKK